MRKSVILLFILTFIAQDILSQLDLPGEYSRKNSFFLQWGYNRTNYRDTEINFEGEGFDFTLSEVSAHDEPTPYSSDIYLNPFKLTIPQFDFRVGYFIKENTSISLGWDHMKYVMESFQRLRINGVVSTDFSEERAGVYNGELIDSKPSFLKFEHTDGLNFVRLGLEQHAEVWKDDQSRFHLDAVFGIAGGPVFTWTDATVNGKRYENWLHLSGWGVSGQLAARFRYKNTFYLQYQHQSGYMYLGDIIFMEDESRAQHKVIFSEQSLVIGAQVPIFIGGNPNKVID